MDRQEFIKLVFEKFLILNPNSLNIFNESEDSITIEIVSNNFVGLSVLKRINKVYKLISKEIETVDFNVNFVTLTVNEKESNSDEQSNNCNSAMKKMTIQDAIKKARRISKRKKGFTKKQKKEIIDHIISNNKYLGLDFEDDKDYDSLNYLILNNKYT